MAGYHFIPPPVNVGLYFPTVVRPLPDDFPSNVKRARLCNRGPSCTKGRDCMFAHSPQEEIAWNRQIRDKLERQRGFRPQWYYNQPNLQGSYAPAQAQSPPQLRRTRPKAATMEQEYAASKESFAERIKGVLDPQIIGAPLTRENYKEKFHNMICWEEKRHIEILDEKCNGEYKLVIYQAGFEPKWMWRTNETRGGGYVRYGHIEGMNADQIAYSTQASEAVFIIKQGEELKSDIMKENFNHTDENLYIGFKGANQLERLFSDLPMSGKTYDHVRIEFEVKHMYFNTLIKSVNIISPLVIQRLLPYAKDFLPKSTDFFRYEHHMHALVSQLDPDDQLSALKAITLCPAQSPPILINGSFGSGKTRVLAIATYYFMEMAKEPTRILICAYQQHSVDSFVDSYFGDMIKNRNFSKRVHLIRLTSDRYSGHGHGKEHSEFYINFNQFCGEKFHNISHGNENVIIATTFSTALRLQELFESGFFTHILLDEGAQTREAENIAPLTLASSGTKIVIAGDSCQVGPALVVLGEETRKSGFKLSLLERLQIEYEKCGAAAKDYLITLSTNYRCHKDILAIPHQLFYSGLKCKAKKADPHPNAPYPVLFVCSNLTTNTCSPKIEAQVLLGQVNKFVQNWPRSWGDRKLKEIAVLTSTRPQLVVTRRLGRSEYPNLHNIRLLTLYQIQGQEVQAVFLSTTEPVDEEGNTCNPTKSPCDRYVFNTVLTRARSLVVVIGSPLVLLRTEKHMVKLYGDKGKCWSLYLKSCLENGTLIIPQQVEPDPAASEQFKEQLAIQLGATLPSRTQKSSRRNYKTLPGAHSPLAPTGNLRPSAMPNIPSALSQPLHTLNKPLNKGTRANSNTKQTTSAGIQVTSAQKVHHETNSSVVSTSLPVMRQINDTEPHGHQANTAPSKSTTVDPKRKVKQTPLNSKLISERHVVTQTASRSPDQQAANLVNRMQSTQHVKNATLPPSCVQPSSNKSPISKRHSSDTVKLQKRPSPLTSTSTGLLVHKESAKSKKRKKVQPATKLTSDHPSHSSALLEDSIWPTLDEASKIKTTKKSRVLSVESPQFAASKGPNIPSVHSESFNEYKDELDIRVLQQPLSRKNYVLKFHHLLCWEEQEHDRILKQRGTDEYDVTFYQRGYTPPNLQHHGDDDLVRYGYISGADGDKLSYAKQASEGSFIVLDETSYIKTVHVYAHVPKEANSNAITFGLTEKEIHKLVQKIPMAKTRWFGNLRVHFELKHSYFQRLHVALTSINDYPEMIQKIVPNEESFVGSENERVWIPSKPTHKVLELDSFQQRALITILNCSPEAPVLVTGPFGTGKTRLLARAAYEILNSRRNNRVLICAHHQASVDTFVDILGDIFDPNEMIRITPNTFYRSHVKDKYPKHFVPKSKVHYNNPARLVITTLGTFKIPGRFSHILLDEGAQAREPEIISPLRFAKRNAKLIFAGDHLQVGPKLLVLGNEAQEYGLATSLLERLHNHYMELGEPAKKHIASLLTNYRSQSGILMLPSSLFYGSTLQCRTKDQPHPLAAYPLHFICTSLNNIKSCSHSKDYSEAVTLLTQVKKFVDKWPEQRWGKKDLSKICVMSPSADQHALIRNTMYTKFKELRDILILKAYEIQGREFRAIFIGTSEITYMKDAPHGHEEGEPKNLTKSVSDQFVFNTAITRSQYLVVAVGNPFLLLNIEKCMKNIYGQKAVRCWSHFMRQCIECNTFHLTDNVRETTDKEELAKLRDALYNSLLHTTSGDTIDIEPDEKDSILDAYQEELARIPEYKHAKLTLSRVDESDLAWIMSDTITQQTIQSARTIPDQEDEEDFEEIYECVLECQSYRKASAKPLDHTKRIVTIQGSGNRIPAFNGDTVTVGVFCNNPEDKCYGRVLEVICRGHEPRFLCRVSHRNPIIFYTIDELNPGFCNLPRISRDLLKRRDRDAIEVELESRKDVVVFSSDSVGVNIREGKVPPIKQIIPLSVAKNMLFTVAFIQWKKAYRTPLGVVVGVVPKGHSAFSAERMLKMKHAIEYDDDGANEEHGDALQGPNSGPLYDRVFTIDPDNAQNLDDAISFVKLSTPKCDESIEHYQLGVHIVNCAKHITQDEEIDRRAKQRGTSIYGGKEGKIMQMLPAKIRGMLSLTPNKIRDVISVVAIVTLDSGKVSVDNAKIEHSQIKSCIQLTYKSAQDIMNGQVVSTIKSEVELYDKRLDQPTLSDTLQLLFKIALDMRRNRLGSDAAYSYDLNEPEDSYCWQSHMLIEEMMVWANNFVAERIHTCYPDTALLRRQPEPNKDALSDFVDQYKSVARFSLSYSHLGCAEDAEDASFIMTASTLSRIKEAISSRNPVHLASLFFSESNHPQIAAVKSKHRSILQRAEYCCTSSDKDDSFYHHYSLKLNDYTHFSSPLRRYLDVEVQRMLVQLTETTPKVFCQSDHQRLCKQLNMRAQNAKQFERSLNQVQLAMKFGSSTEVYEAFIADNVKGTIELWFPHLELNTFPQKERKVPLKNLGPYANVKNEDLESTITNRANIFHWRIQMTSFSADEGKFVFKFPKLLVKEDSKEFNTGDNITVIDVVANDEHDSTLSKVTHKAGRDTPVTVKLSLDQWRKALNFVKDPTKDNIKEVESAFSTLSAAPHVQNTVTSVGIKSSAPLVYVDCQMDFKTHDVVQVWLTRSMRKALMAPTIQMIEVSPLWRICVQHNTHPAECFSDQNLSQASRKFYSDINEYVDLWEKLLLAEAAEKSVKDSKQVVIHDVNLEWPSLCIPSNCIDEEYYQPTGSIVLNLPTKFVENCSEFIKFSEGDLVCARYGTDTKATARAVFHMVVHKIHYNDDYEIQPSKVLMKFIGENNCRISEKMKTVLENKARCELQLISLSTSYQRVYRGLLKLRTKSDHEKTPAASKKRSSGKREIGNLVTQVALGKEIKIKVIGGNKEITGKVFKEHLLAKQLWTTPYIYLNRVQQEAANLACSKPFQLIQGPPGTGKSETGAHIAYIFAMANRQLSPAKCVLYCGPSNKSVDVVLEKLDTLCKSNPKLKLKILRIYGRAVETNVHSGADNYGRPKSDYTIPEYARAYALHNRIRLEGPSAFKLREFEKKLEHLPEGRLPSGRMCQEYRKILTQAEDEVLGEHYDIVLCTCNETSSGRIARCIFPRQCIVDECGMANEPECITPLQLCDHVVLIGDHKQLQPVIDYQPAKENGLSTSLFQRYAENLVDKDFLMKTLVIQYRMHEAICEFPSQHFYDGILETARSVKERTNPETKLDRFWPGPEKSRCPILFCDVIGKEGDHKTGSKAAGGRKIGIDSKYNEIEANKVVEIVNILRKVHNVHPSQIAVLTPYSAQKHFLLKKMKEAKIEIKVASITESQGDEYGIVILSTVRSLPHKEIANPKHVQADRGWLLENLGFLTDAHQLNVGITRSKYGLIIVGNKELLSYDKNWKALIDHYQDKQCIVKGEEFGIVKGNKCGDSIRRKPPPVPKSKPVLTDTARLAEVLKSKHFKEAENRAQVPFLHHCVLECGHNGLEYTIEDHDITLRIAQGTVPNEKKIHFEIGVASYGPFVFPNNTQPISPIIWLCILEEDFELTKPFQLIFPHFLTGLDRKMLAQHQIKLTKASHNIGDKLVYTFVSDHCDNMPMLASCKDKSYALIESKHCCFYCLEAKRTKKLSTDASYCLHRIEHIPFSSRNEVHFAATYFLDTCIQALNEQYPNREGYKITHMKFKFDESQDPFIEVVHPNDHPRVSAIAMEPTPGQIKASSIDFYKTCQDFESMRLQHRISVYPPRVKMTVAVESQGGAFTLPMNIRGCSSNYNLDTGIIFPIAHSAASRLVISDRCQSRMITARDGKPKFSCVLEELLPLASNWEIIGSLLDIDHRTLDIIRSDGTGVKNQLRMMLIKWHTQISPMPTWNTLANAIEPVDEATATRIRGYIAE